MIGYKLFCTRWRVYAALNEAQEWIATSSADHAAVMLSVLDAAGSIKQANEALENSMPRIRFERVECEIPAGAKPVLLTNVDYENVVAEQRSMMTFAKQHDWGQEATYTLIGVYIPEVRTPAPMRTLIEPSHVFFSLYEMRQWAGY